MNRDLTYLKHRDELLSAYKNRCACCGGEGKLEIHHIVPLMVGGTNRITNLAPLCHACHKAAHTGRNISEYVKSERGPVGGRTAKMSFDDFDKIFEDYISGKIGRKKLLELTGYSRYLSRSNCPNYEKALEKRGISSLRNNIDICMTNCASKPQNGDIVGYIKYTDGRKENIYFNDTGENNVEYTARSNNTVPFSEKKKEIIEKRIQRGSIVLHEDNNNQLSFIGII